MEFKLVIGTKSGKSYQKEVKDTAADALHNQCIGDTVDGDKLGFPGYEFLVTGGSDKCGFPMRKGIQTPRKQIMAGKGVGFSGLDRNNKKQKGLMIKKTVCGDRISKIIHQVNLKIVKEGPRPLSEEAPVTQK